jgi:hypothetical protein
MRPTHFPNVTRVSDLPGLVDAELGRLVAAIGPRLGRRLDELIRTHGFDQDHLAHPLNQPIVLLTRWVADSPILSTGVDGSAVDALTLATIIGYLYVRVQDDVVDEGTDDDPAAMLLADALLVRHVALVAREAGDSARFWDFFERTAWAYGDAMLLERELHRPGAPYRETDFDAVIRRSEPIVIPSAVLLDRSDRWEHLPRLLAFAHLVTRAGQLVDDLRDAARDRDSGNYTWVVREMGGLDGKGQMLTTIALGGFDSILGRAERDLDAAAGIAADLELPAAVQWLGERRQAMGEMRRTFYGALGVGWPVGGSAG